MYSDLDVLNRKRRFVINHMLCNEYKWVIDVLSGEPVPTNADD